MLEFNEVELKNNYEKYLNQKQLYLDDIKKIVSDSNTPLEGNSFYIHNSLTLYPELYTKQLNLFWAGQQAKTRICEIGFNAGHSTMLMILGRDRTPLDLTIFDIGYHSYTRHCLNYIRNTFNHINFEYIEGDSTMTIPKWIEDHCDLIETYDVVHIDGGHSEYCIFNDIKNADRLVKKGGIVIIDDTNIDYINKYVDYYISSNKYTELTVLKTTGYPHRIIQKIEHL